MSGIALIIPGADFSDSPLGQVTFKKSLKERVAEAVAAYQTATGVTGYTDELSTLVMGLMTTGAWDTLEVYPMLGSTDTSIKKEINPDVTYVKGKLTYPTSTVVGTNCVQLQNTVSTAVATGEGGEIGYSDRTNLVGIYKFVSFYKRELQTQSSLVLGGTPSIRTSAVSGQAGKAILTFNFPTGVAQTPENLNTLGVENRVNATLYRDTDNYKMFNGSTLLGTYSQELTAGSPTTNNIIGSMSAAGSGDIGLYTNSNVYMVAIGKVQSDKVTEVNKLLTDFVNAVKPLS